MAIYIDSEIEGEVQQAKEYGWVRGVTTNPILLRRAFSVLQTLINHPLSSEAVAQFDLEGTGINARR